MDVAVLGSRTGVRLELRPVAGRRGDGSPRWQFRVTGRGVSAVLEASEAGWEPQSLADFLSDIARDWRGWDGDRRWQSEEAEVRLAVRHDGTNTVLVRVELEDGAPPRWRCEAELELDPGAFEQLAAAVREVARGSAHGRPPTSG